LGSNEPKFILIISQFLTSDDESIAKACAYHDLINGRAGAQTRRTPRPRHEERYRGTKKWPRLRGHFLLVVPMTVLVVPMAVTLDDYRSVAVTMVPAAMQAAIMGEKLGARPAKVVPVAVVFPVAADAEAEALCTRHRRRGNRKGRQCGENARNLLHVASPIVVAIQKKRLGQSDVPGTATELS
jgi:hypothetical protein